MTLLTVDEIVFLHTKLITKTGGLDGLRDKGLLESAVCSVNASFFDVEKYPTIIEKSARLAYVIVNNHAFIDGNKRIGILVMIMTLKLNNINIKYTQNELIDLGLDIASGKAGYKNIYEWIKQHLI